MHPKALREAVMNTEGHVVETDFYGDPVARTPLARIYHLEAAVRKLPQYEAPLEHHFADGVYVRTMFIPKGMVLVGHIHRYPCVNIVQYGEIEVATEEGNKRIVGPATFTSAAGIKRAGFALRDTLWTTIHANHDDERDVDVLFDRLIVPPLLEDQS